MKRSTPGNPLVYVLSDIASMVVHIHPQILNSHASQSKLATCASRKLRVSLHFGPPYIRLPSLSVPPPASGVAPHVVFWHQEAQARSWGAETIKVIEGVKRTMI